MHRQATPFRLLALLSIVAPPCALAQELQLLLPFHPDQAALCTQGPGGNFSHSGQLTSEALDFAVGLGTEVVAAADGVAYIAHDVPDPSFNPPKCTQATSRGFGNYVTVDHGGGLFTLYSHLQTIAPGIHGETVFGGKTVLGTVNSTGYSCGNHLHFGLHQGNAQNLFSSTPVPITHLTAKQLLDGTSQVFTAREFQCGDPGIGRRYAREADLGLLLDDFEDGDIADWTFRKFGSNSSTASWGLVQDGTTVLELVGGTSNGGGNVVAHKTGFSSQDYSVAARVKVHEVRNGGHHSSVVARYTDDLNFYELSLNQGQSLLRLLAWENGVERTIDTLVVPSSVFNDWIDLELETVGNQLRAYVNGDLLIDTHDYIHQEGSAGILNGGSVTRFDDLLVESRALTLGPGVAFEDDFNDGTIDRGKWITEGFTVSEEDGEFRIDVTRTDAGGTANTGYIRINPERPIVVERLFKVHYANTYFDGQLRFRPRNHEESAFGISYAHYFYNGGASCTTDQWSIFRNNVNSHYCPDRLTDAAVIDGEWWDEWIDETIRYDPVTGELVYYMDGVERGSFNVGPLPDDLQVISLRFGVWGWFTGHYQHMDWIVVRQE